MRVAIGVALLFVLSGVASAEEKFDAKKLVGKWEMAAEKAPSLVIEFGADGKMTGSVGPAGMEMKFKGTYKLEGNKLTLVTDLDGKEQTRVVTLTKLTDEEMTGENDKGVKSTFKKVKK